MAIEIEIIEQIASKNSVSRLEVEAVLKGFSILEGFVISIGNLEKLTPTLINIQYDLLKQLMKPFHKSALFFNIETNRRPDANSRRVIIGRLKGLSTKIGHIAFGNGKNTIAENATQFMMAQTEINNFSIHHNQAEAMEKLRTLKSAIGNS